MLRKVFRSKLATNGKNFSANLKPPHMNIFFGSNQIPRLVTEVTQFLGFGMGMSCIGHSSNIYLRPIASIIRQNGESQNGCFKKTKGAEFSEKRTFLTP